MDTFLRDARAAYGAANAATLRWMLDRPRRHGAFVDTKMNALTGADYGPADGWRGPAVTFGWIQGRALEAIATHARFYETEDPGLTDRLDEAGRALYAALAGLLDADGHAYFAYDEALKPVWPDAQGRLLAQSPGGRLFTFSDTFVRKGLVAGAARYAPQDLDARVAGLLEVVAAIEDDRFVSDERQRIDEDALARDRRDYGPRMILLGAAAMLRELGRSDAAAFGERFVADVLASNRRPDGSLADVPGDDTCNPGHAIEFAGFGFGALPEGAAGRDDLVAVLRASAALGFHGPGIALKVSHASGRPVAPWYPWWPLPEAIRAGALAWRHTGDPRDLALWRRAHEAFFGRFWRGRPPIAYQTLTEEGPADFVPATPDLDPGYHTGLSLLGAIGVIDAVAAAG
jgi:hypothetical protein